MNRVLKDYKTRTNRWKDSWATNSSGSPEPLKVYQMLEVTKPNPTGRRARPSIPGVRRTLGRRFRRTSLRQRDAAAAVARPRPPQGPGAARVDPHAARPNPQTPAARETPGGGGRVCLQIGLESPPQKKAETKAKRKQNSNFGFPLP